MNSLFFSVNKLILNCDHSDKLGIFYFFNRKNGRILEPHLSFQFQIQRLVQLAECEEWMMVRQE